MRDIIDYQEKYKKEPFEDVQASYRRKKIIDLLLSCEHSNILEVGCGLEPLFCHFQGYQKMVVVEPSPDFYQRACAYADGRVTCINGFMEDCVQEVSECGTQFDYIVVSSLLHEVERPETLLAAVKKLCHAGTVVHVNVPNAVSLHRLLAFEMGLIKEVHERSDLQITMQRNRVFDLESLEDAVGQAGFTVLDKGSYCPKMFTHHQMKQMMDAGIITEKTLEGLYKMEKYFPEYGSEIYVQMKVIR